MRRKNSKLRIMLLRRTKNLGEIIILVSLLAMCSASIHEVSRNQASDFGSAEAPRNPDQADYMMMAYLTGYSYWDNTPPGSAAIARPIIHREAGGVGTYEDPITLAVGHSIIGSVQRLDFPAGTRFYFPELRRYAIVEDVCGDGPRPQDGPCHIGHNDLPWLDIYVGGEVLGASAATSCMYAIGGVQQVIRNPSRGYPVIAAPLTECGCSV